MIYMRKNTFKHFFLFAAMIPVGSVVMAQKPSDKKFSAEIAKVKKLQSERNMMIGRTKQNASAAGSETNFQAPGTASMQPALARPASNSVKPSQQPLQVPVRSRPVQKVN